MSKVFLFGIDGSAPELIFNQWLDELPTIKSIMEKGIYAKMNSVIPPSTIIAWNAMISGRDASEQGVFSFTYKDDNGNTKLVNSANVKCDRIWNILDKNDKKSIALFVPLTYPVKPINGVMVGGFLSPGVNKKSVYPEKILEKIDLDPDDIFFDVAVGLAGHKGMEIDTLIKKTYEMTNKQLALIEDLIQNEEWDFFMSVTIGSDRLQHMLWQHFDKTHRRFIKDSKHKDALKDYYKYLDSRLAKILKMIPNDTTVIVASDHGMIKQEGKINLNNWLIKKGYLVLTDNAKETIVKDKVRFKFEFIDMNKTKVYASGAYNARVFLNKDIIGDEFENFQEQLIKEIKEIPDDSGKKLETYIYKKNDIYKYPDHPQCPDLTVYFDDLRWACNPDLGQKGLYSWKTAVGADSAGHSRQGIFMMMGPSVKAKGKIDDINIKQVYPTILKIMDIEIPKDLDIKTIKVN